MSITGTSCTHIGRRENNEDSTCVDEELGLFAVADGIGGYAGGEVASQLAVDTMQEFFSMQPGLIDEIDNGMSGVLRDALRTVTRRIARNSSGRLSKMCTTLVSMVVTEEKVYVMHVGDSRVYRVRGGRLTQLTQDHSLVNEMRHAAGTDVTASVEFELGHIVTQYVGAGHSPSPDIAEFSVQTGDRFLLCSDGLSDILSESQICETMSRGSSREACEDLVWDAYHLGGADNITAVVVDVA
jgi:serine/threonine protein phosphatase PrpC